MPHIKFQGHWPVGSIEEDFKDFYHIWTWRPSRSYEMNYLYSLSFPIAQKLHIKFGFNRPNGF